MTATSVFRGLSSITNSTFTSRIYSNPPGEVAGLSVSEIGKEYTGLKEEGATAALARLRVEGELVDYLCTHLNSSPQPSQYLRSRDESHHNTTRVMSGTNDPRLTQANFAWGASSDPPISSFRPAAPGGFGSQWSTMSGSQQSTPFPSPSSTHASQQLAVVTTPSASDMNANNGTSVQDTIQGSQVTKKERESEVKCEELML